MHVQDGRILKREKFTVKSKQMPENPNNSKVSFYMFCLPRFNALGLPGPLLLRESDSEVRELDRELSSSSDPEESSMNGLLLI